MIGRVLSSLAVAYGCCQPGIADSADVFKRLTTSEIRGRIVGKVVTDQSHWSDRFNRDGTLTAVDLGILKPGSWKLAGNEMCVVRKGKVSSSECFEIWMQSNQVQYRRDGITFAEGVLRDE